MKMFDVLIVILFVMVMILVLWYLFGNSPTFEQTMLALILTLVVANTVSLKEVKTKHSMYARYNDQKVNDISRELKEHLSMHHTAKR